MESSNSLPAASAGLTVVVGLLPSAMVPGTQVKLIEILLAGWLSLMAVLVLSQRSQRMGAARELGAQVDEAI